MVLQGFAHGTPPARPYWSGNYKFPWYGCHQPSRIIAAGIYVGLWYEAGLGRYLRAGDLGFLLTVFVYEIREST